MSDTQPDADPTDAAPTEGGPRDEGPTDERPTTEIASDAAISADDAPTTELTDDSVATTEIAPDARPEPPRPARGRAVWALLGGLLFCALAGPFVFYFGFWRFEPTAQRHVPAGTVLAVRLDAREIYLWKPFREHLLPALVPPPEDPTRPSLLARIRSNTSVDLQTDVREVVIATPDAQRWVVLAGGRFLGSTRRGPFVDGYELAVEQEPGAGDWVREGDLLVAPFGQVIAQADDGTILAASNADLARAALPATEDYRDLWLSSAGDVSFSLLRAALMHLAATHRGGVPEVAVLDRADRVTGFVNLEDHESKVAVELFPVADHPIEVFGADVEKLVRRLAADAAAPADPKGPAHRLPAGRALLAGFFTKAKVQTRGSSVLVRGKIGKEPVQAAAVELGALLGEARRLH